MSRASTPDFLAKDVDGPDKPGHDGVAAMTIIDDTTAIATAAPPADSIWRHLRYHIARHPLGAVGAAIMAIFVFAAIFAGFLTRYDPVSTNSALSLARPTADHIFGCDFMGRDIYSRIIYGARISLAVGLGSAGLGCAVGVALGLTSGYLGGWVDLIIQRLVDIMQALPVLILALVMAAALGPALDNTIVAISIPLIP